MKQFVVIFLLVFPSLFEALSLNTTKVDPTWQEILPTKCGYSGMKLHRFFTTGRRLERATSSEELNPSSIDAHPWQVAITDELDNLKCGGSIISQFCVLTAAQCFYHVGTPSNRRYRVLSPKNLFVLAGNSRYQESDYRYSINRIFIHTMFRLKYIRNDIALVKINRGFVWTPRIFPICLAEEGVDLVGRLCTTSGFETDVEAGYMQKGLVELSVLQKCKNHTATNTTMRLCVEALFMNPSFINLGGPLTCDKQTLTGQQVLTGIASQKLNSSSLAYYVDVTKYLPWIRSFLEFSTKPQESDVVHLDEEEVTDAPMIWDIETITPINTVKHTWRDILPRNCGLRGNELSHTLIRNKRIANGQYSGIVRHPWQVATLRPDGNFHCAGSIISQYHVITSASCWHSGSINRFSEQHVQNFTLLAGSTKLNKSWKGVRHRISQIYIHEHFSTFFTSPRNDIALLKIAGEFFWTNNINPICLPSMREVYAGNRSCEVSGYGRNSYNDENLLEVLQDGPIDLFPQENCKEIYSRKRKIVITDGMFCAGQLENDAVVDITCKGDLGGPLQCASEKFKPEKRILLGIISFGVGSCGTSGFPGIYTKVAKYIPWIHDYVEVSMGLRKRENIRPSAKIDFNN